MNDTNAIEINRSNEALLGLPDEIAELVAKGRESLRVKREAKEREKEADRIKKRAELDQAWERFEAAAYKHIPEFLHPYVRLTRSETQPPGSYEIVNVEVPGFDPLDFSFSKSCDIWVENRREFDFPFLAIEEVDSFCSPFDYPTWHIAERKSYSTGDLAEALALAQAQPAEREALQAEVNRLNEESRLAHEQSRAAATEDPTVEGDDNGHGCEPDLESLVARAESSGTLDMLLVKVFRAIARAEGDNACSSWNGGF